MLRKIIIYTLITLTVVFAVLASLPFIFKDEIEKKAKTEIATMFDADIDFSNVNMSFIRNFPNVSVKLENFRIVGKNDFAKDTLIFSKDINLIINIKSLFGDNGYDIRKLEFNDSKVVVRVLPNGKANWEIWKTDTTEVADTSGMNFHWKLHEFNINNADITYNYESANMKFVFEGLNHSTSGDFTADSSQLVTKTTCDSLSYIWDGFAYLSKAKATLNANIDANLNDMKFIISENKSQLNDLPFQLNGWLKGINDGWDMDLVLNTKNASFKSILSLIPAFYANSLEDMKTGGDFEMSGTVKGLYIGDFYPAFDLKLKAANGWFQYPSLPKSVQNIQIDARVKNPGRTLDETTIDVSNFSFLLGGNPFKATMHIENPMTNTLLAMNAQGKINLGMIKEVYPLDEKTILNGLFEMNLKLAARQADIEQNKYEKIDFAGTMSISKLEAETSALPQKILVNNARVLFNNRFVELPTLSLQIGKNDLSATGRLENFVAYALHDKTLKGNLTISSNYLNVSNFMSKSAEPTTVDSSSAPLSIIHIPANIDFVIQANVKKLLYDKMVFDNVKGELTAANSELKMNDVAMNGFGGTLLMNGIYSTADTLKPKVNLDMQIKDVGFKEIFAQVETLQKFAPILGKAAGKFTTTLNFNSLLKGDMMPDLASIIGGGTFNTQQVGLKNVPAIDVLASKLNKSDLIPMTIKDLAMNFSIADGKLTTKPFNFKIKETNFTLGGSTGIDKTIAYTGKVQLPDKLKIGNFSTVGFKMGGTFQKPTIELDLKNTATDLINNVKEKAVQEVTKKVDDAKQKALEEARKQKENAIRTANEKADKLIAEAVKQGDILIDEAKKQGNALIAKATNPLTKKAAEIAAKKLEDTARKQAAALVEKTKAEAAKVVENASNEVKI